MSFSVGRRVFPSIMSTTRGARAIAVFCALPALLMACGADVDSDDPSIAAATPALEQALDGLDGDLTLAAGTTVLNQYAVFAVDVAAGAQQLTVTNIADLASPSFGALAAGDLLLLYQAYGATIDTTDTAAYGTIGALGNAGRYEFVTVLDVDGNVIRLDNSAVVNGYTAIAGAQVVRVPRLATLTIPAGATLSPADWNGTRGGIVAVQATKTVTLNGTISVAGNGFRGGAADNASNAVGNIGFRATTDATGANKGESVAGFTPENGNFGRGAPANGGGGGNAHNAGGGGGGNVDNGVVWTGLGTPSPSDVGAAAWSLDGDIANANAVSSGGGRGGYSFSTLNGNALTQGPGSAANWGGDTRRNVGGRGGRGLVANAANRVFFGGGGGAGDANNNSASRGGDGGGLVFVLAPTVNGTGVITANGEGGGTGANDGGGGGGAGGSVIVRATSLAGVTITSAGGTGGSITLDAHGPGGGGSGGFVATGGGAVTINIAGAAGGTNASSTVNEFPKNGATGGASGVTVTATTVAIADRIDARCGNGTIDDAEECDDGNRIAGDGCDGGCELEAGVVGACSIGDEPALAVTAANSIINTYAPGVGVAAKGSTSITIGAIRDTTPSRPFTVGDLLLVVQMQGAVFDLGRTTPANFGDGPGFFDRAGFFSQDETTFSAGRFERVRVTAVSGNTLTIKGRGAAAGLLNSYVTAGPTTVTGQSSFQIVRVPEPSSMTIAENAGIIAATWNGSSGGIVAVAVRGALSFAAASSSIDASARGFRGGQARTNTTNNQGGFGSPGTKGEGLAGTPALVYSTADSALSTVVDGYPTQLPPSGGTPANPTFAENVGAPGNAGGNAIRSTDAAGGGGGGAGRGGRGGRGGTGIADAGLGGGTTHGQLLPSRHHVFFGGGGGGASGDDAFPGLDGAQNSAGQSGGGAVFVWANNISGSAGAIRANGGTRPLAAGEGGGGLVATVQRHF